MHITHRKQRWNNTQRILKFKYPYASHFSLESRCLCTSRKEDSHVFERAFLYLNSKWEQKLNKNLWPFTHLDLLILLFTLAVLCVTAYSTQLMNDIFQEDSHSIKWMRFLRFFLCCYRIIFILKKEQNVVADISAQFLISLWSGTCTLHSSMSEKLWFSLNIVIYHIPHSLSHTQTNSLHFCGYIEHIVHCTGQCSRCTLHTTHVYNYARAIVRCTTIYYCAYMCAVLNEKDEKPKILLSVQIYFHICTKRFSLRSHSHSRTREWGKSKSHRREMNEEPKSWRLKPQAAKFHIIANNLKQATLPHAQYTVCRPCWMCVSERT